MPSVCFTGKGVWPGPTLSGFTTSKALSRAEWTEKAHAAGYGVVGNALHADILVASRTDTSKAVKARARGAKIITYGDFVQMLEQGGVSRPEDMIDPPPLSQATQDYLRAWVEHTHAMEEAMDSNPLWGTF